MTSKVQIICNGPSYVARYVVKDGAGNITAAGEIRGGETAQSFTEAYLGQNCTIEVTEVYDPKAA